MIRFLTIQLFFSYTNVSDYSDPNHLLKDSIPD